MTSGPASGQPGAGDRDVHVVLSIDPVRFSEVVLSASAAGLVVEQEMSAVGVVSGHVARDRVPALEAVDGVEAVEEDRPVRLPPPDSPLQ